MSFESVLAELEAMGTAQNRKVYARYGIGENMFGVSYANLALLKKRIKKDHSLAQALWASGNHDARILATMIADPAALSEADLEAYVHGVDSYVQADALAGLAFRSPHGMDCMLRWIKSQEEWIGRAGWDLLGQFAMQEAALPDEFFLPYLQEIEATIHNRPNRIREGMHNALLAMGIRNAALEEQAVAAAGRIGKVYIDHGQTGCKTPDTVPYIRKARLRKARQANGESRA